MLDICGLNHKQLPLSMEFPLGKNTLAWEAIPFFPTQTS